MTAPSPIYEGFSVSHAQVLDGTETFLDALTKTGDALEDWDVYGVREASMEPDTDSFDNEGDDVVLSKWNWINFVELSITAGYISFPLLSTLTGAPVEVTTDASSNVTDQRIDLWSERVNNIKPRPMLIRMPSRDKEGKPVSLIAGLYRVNFGPMAFDGPSYKEGLAVSYTGQAVLTDQDETGTPLTDTDNTGQIIKQVGKLIAVL